MNSSQGTFIVLAAARRDLYETATFLGEHNPVRAAKFLEAARDTMAQLADAPHLGSPRPQDNPGLHSMRRWPIKDFKQYGIFYRPFASGNGIEVFRVLHSSRESQTLLQESLES